MSTTDNDWQAWGLRDPYFAVLSHRRFRRDALDAEARREFFALGRFDANVVLKTCRDAINPQFLPQRILDFGCGVGRVLIPFAEIAEEVVGMDIAPSMLSEARLNCEEHGLENIKLLLADDQLTAVTGCFDLVHSTIVLQHIEVDRGRNIFRRLVELVRPGGIGALHVTYACDKFAETFGAAPATVPAPVVPAHEPPSVNAARQVKHRAWHLLRFRSRATSAPLTASAVGDVADDPEMRMNFYNLSDLMFLLQFAGVHQVHLKLTDHGGAFGVFLYFEKPAAI